MIEEGSQVSIEYTLTLEDGTEVATNVGEDPLQYRQGDGQILPALEQALTGLGVDDTNKVTLSPEQGYGPVNPEAFREVAIDQVPEDARKEGAILVAEADDDRRPIRVHEVKEDKVVLDFNHPLAGQTLVFDVKVLAVE